MKQLVFPQDEFPHKNQAVEWWYFNGFLQGKKDYAFMTCLFKINPKKIKISFLEFPFKTIYFSHSVFYDLTSKKIKKEILPIVALSKDSFKQKNLFINYHYPLRKEFIDYEISRAKDKFRVKNSYFDLVMKEKKPVLLENNTGYINLGEKSTYWYSYPHLEVKGCAGKENVRGIAWYDRQWSSQGSMQDKWLWFSFQLEDNTQIFCVDYKGKKYATISYPDNIQETLEPKLISLNKKMISKRTGIEYELEWKIKIGKFNIITKPIIKDCEMNFGTTHYWEGPVQAICNGIQAKGFMEQAVVKQNKTIDILEKIENLAFDAEKILEKKHLFA